MKGVDRQQTVESLQNLFKGMGLGYDFLYLPWDGKRNANIGLGFVNFLDGSSAEICIERLGLLKTRQGGKICKSVSKSYAHGLANNLAFFLVSAGVKSLDNDHVPLVFDTLGNRINLRWALTHYVTMDLLMRTDALWRQTRQGRQRGETTQGVGTGGFSSELLFQEVPGDMQREAKGHGKPGMSRGEWSVTVEQDFGLGTQGGSQQKHQLVSPSQRVAGLAVESWPLSQYHRPGRVDIPSQRLPCLGEAEQSINASGAAVQQSRPLVSPQHPADLGMAMAGPCAGQRSPEFCNSRDLMESKPSSCSTSQPQCRGGSAHAKGIGGLRNHVQPAGAQQRENTESGVKFTHFRVGDHEITIVDF